MALPPNIKITDYIPAWDEIPNADLLDARDRLVAYLQTGIPDLDTSPGSTFGDLHINPLAHLMAAVEVAANRMYSDLDLGNVSSGVIWNCDYTKRYLDNFGQKERPAVGSYGVVQLAFNAPRSYVIDADTKFVFGGNFIFRLVDNESALIVDRSLSGGNSGLKTLKQVGEGYYTLDIPVVGPAGALVAAGDTASSGLSNPELISITAISDFDRGLLPLSVSELASNVSNTFYAASLNNRSGAITYILNNFPEVIGVSPVMTGDREMMRDRKNILGISEGKADIFVKYRSSFLPTTSTVALMHNPSEGVYAGKIPTGSDIPVLFDSVADTANQVLVANSNIWGRSQDNYRFPGQSAGFSNREDLGLVVTPVGTLEILQEASISTATTDSTEFTLGVSGQYTGTAFSTETKRTLRLDVVGSTATVVVCRLIDTNTGEHVDVNIDESGVVETTDYNNFLGGINLHIAHIPAEAWDAADFGSPVSFVFDVAAQTVLFDVAYRYEPNLKSVIEFVELDHAKAVNVDLVVKSPLTCAVNNLTVNYRVRPGQNVDITTAKSEIFTYVNSIIYPNVFEPSQVMEILLYYGAEGVSSVVQHGVFHRTLADTYENEDGTNTAISSVYTSTLVPDSDVTGVGVRNVHYILDLENIKFNAKAI